MFRLKQETSSETVNPSEPDSHAGMVVAYVNTAISEDGSKGGE